MARGVLHFVNVIDLEMKISHVIRGEDHLSTRPTPSSSLHRAGGNAAAIRSIHYVA